MRVPSDNQTFDNGKLKTVMVGFKPFNFGKTPNRETGDEHWYQTASPSTKLRFALQYINGYITGDIL